MENYLNKIKNDKLYNFTKKAIEKFGDTIKTVKANKVADIVYKKFISMGYVYDDVQQNFVDITLSAALMYNLFAVREDVSSLFKCRTMLKDIEVECELDAREAVFIYELIESQLGDEHPIQKLKPTPNTPAYTLAEAIWYVEVYPNL